MYRIIGPIAAFIAIIGAYTLAGDDAGNMFFIGFMSASALIYWMLEMEHKEFKKEIEDDDDQ